MKTRIFFMLISLLLSVTYLSAQVVQTVNVPTAGGLATAIGSNLKTVTDLTLTGTINATDFQTIKQMTALKNIDMSEVDVVEKAIPAYAFQGRVLNRLVLPEGLETLGSNSFEGSILQEPLVLPSSLKTISNHVFKNSQTKLDLSKSILSLELLGSYSFESYKGNTKLDFSKHHKLSTIQSSTFLYYTGHVIIPSNMTVLSPGSFISFRGSVDLPEGLEILGSNSFESSTLKEPLVLPSSLKTISNHVFKNSQTKLDLSKSILSLELLGSYSFESYKGNTELDFSKHHKLSTIQSSTFLYYTGHVIIPSNMTVLSPGSFISFRGSATLHEGLKTIDAFAFSSAQMSSLILPEGLEILGSNSFEGSILQEPLVLPSSLKTISNHVFKNSQTKLDLSKSILSLELLGSYSFESYKGNTKLDFSKHHKLSTIQSSTFLYYTGHVIIPSNMTVLSPGSFISFRGSVDLPESLKTIGSSAFQNSTIKEIELPASVTSIGSNAFYNCIALENIISLNTIPPALGTNVFYGVNKTTCELYVPFRGLPLYQTATQWKDFLIGTYTFDMRLADSNLYRVTNDELFTIKMPAYVAQKVNLGLYTLDGVFLESINKSNDRGLIACQISDTISDGSYLIQPYIQEEDKKKIVSRVSGSHNIDRLPITVENDSLSRGSVRNAVATADISNHLMFKTDASDLLEVTYNQSFNVLVHYKNATTAIMIGLYDALTGTMVADVTESVRGNDYTCKIPASVLPGEYNLIPYELASGKPVLVERAEDVSYLIDRLPLTVVATNTTKSLVTDETVDKVNVSVYPNPATDVIYVSGGNIQQLFIYDMNGRKVLTSNGSTSLQIGDLAKGTYILIVKTSDGESTHKIVKK